jgi:hypothetical protein
MTKRQKINPLAEVTIQDIYPGFDLGDSEDHTWQHVYDILAEFGDRSSHQVSDRVWRRHLIRLSKAYVGKPTRKVTRKPRTAGDFSIVTVMDDQILLDELTLTYRDQKIVPALRKASIYILPEGDGRLTLHMLLTSEALASMATLWAAGFIYAREHDHQDVMALL